jgi:hypothetical protein
MNNETEGMPQGGARCLLWDTISEISWEYWGKLQQVLVVLVGVRANVLNIEMWKQNSS